MTTDSLLDKIPLAAGHFNYYIIWANGKAGSISDYEGHGVYRFYRMINEDEKHLEIAQEDHPVVAIGIVGYWLHYRNCNDRIAAFCAPQGPKDIIDIFTVYTKDKLNQYKERHRDDPSSWRRNLEYEFFVEFIIPNEEKLNRQTEALFEYITDNDTKKVQDLMKEYILFLKTKKQEYEGITSASNEEIIRPQNIDEQKLRSHFALKFKGDIQKFPDKIPLLMDLIQNTKSDIGIGKIALQIYESKYFFKDNYTTFTQWYRDFCLIIGTVANPNYTKGKFKISPKEKNSTYYFLHDL